MGLCPSDHDPLHLIQGNLIAGAVVEPGSLRGFMGGDGPGVLQGPSIVQVSGDTGGPKGVATSGFGQSRTPGPPLDHAEHVDAGQAIAGQLSVFSSFMTLVQTSITVSGEYPVVFFATHLARTTVVMTKRVALATLFSFPQCPEISHYSN